MAKKSNNQTGKKHPIWPSKKTGQKSGPGRDNNPPKSKTVKVNPPKPKPKS